MPDELELAEIEKELLRDPDDVLELLILAKCVYV